MRLTDLNPRWVGLSNWSSPAPFYIGFSFDCPHCVAKGKCPTCGHYEAKRLAVYFDPPIDPQNISASFAVPVQARAGAHHRVSGESFDTLTISPSIGFEGIGHWHGNVTNGEATP